MPRRLPTTWPQALPSILSRKSSWPRARSGDRHSIADIRQEVFEVAVLVALRFERYAAHLAVAGHEAAADRDHAAPFRTVDRHRVEDAERGREHLATQP